MKYEIRYSFKFVSLDADTNTETVVANGADTIQFDRAPSGKIMGHARLLLGIMIAEEIERQAGHLLDYDAVERAVLNARLATTPEAIAAAQAELERLADEVSASRVRGP